MLTTTKPKFTLTQSVTVNGMMMKQRGIMVGNKNVTSINSTGVSCGCNPPNKVAIQIIINETYCGAKLSERGNGIID